MSLSNFTLKAIPSLISKNVCLDGNIKNGGLLELEGKVKGNVEADTLTIRESGEVIGEVKCKIFNIKGAFNGNVIAEKINISDTAKIEGNLEYKFLSADYGANINCKLKRVEDIKNNILIDNSTKKEPIDIVQNKKIDIVEKTKKA